MQLYLGHSRVKLFFYLLHFFDEQNKIKANEYVNVFLKTYFLFYVNFCDGRDKNYA